MLLHHVSALPPAAVDRFERSEAPVAAVQLAAARLPTEGSSPGGGGPEPVAGLVGMAPAVVARPSGELRSSGATIQPEGRLLPADVRERLRPQAGPGADVMRVHQGEVADTVARDRGADAVTLGRDVFFREGQFRPREPRGFGLLVHEATHVMQLLQPGVAWRRATGAGVQDEEAEALGRERRAGAMAAPEPRPLSPVRGARQTLPRRSRLVHLVQAWPRHSVLPSHLDPHLAWGPRRQQAGRPPSRCAPSRDARWSRRRPGPRPSIWKNCAGR